MTDEQQAHWIQTEHELHYVQQQLTSPAIGLNASHENILSIVTCSREVERLPRKHLIDNMLQYPFIYLPATHMDATVASIKLRSLSDQVLVWELREEEHRNYLELLRKNKPKNERHRAKNEEKERETLQQLSTIGRQKAELETAMFHVRRLAKVDVKIYYAAVKPLLEKFLQLHAQRDAIQRDVVDGMIKNEEAVIRRLVAHPVLPIAPIGTGAHSGFQPHPGFLGAPTGTGADTGAPLHSSTPQRELGSLLGFLHLEEEPPVPRPVLDPLRRRLFRPIDPAVPEFVPTLVLPPPATAGQGPAEALGNPEAVPGATA